MKKVVLILALIAFIPSLLKADPAKKVIVTYNKDNSKLKIVAQHPVKDINDHYVDLITISVDGKEVKELKFNKQSSSENQTIEVLIPEIKKGSEVEVKTRCNEYGTKKGSLTIE